MKISFSVSGCEKKGVFLNDPSPEVVMRLFVKYIDNNPKALDKGVDLVMIKALNENYPCK